MPTVYSRKYLTEYLYVYDSVFFYEAKAVLFCLQFSMKCSLDKYDVQRDKGLGLRIRAYS